LIPDAQPGPDGVPPRRPVLTYLGSELHIAPFRPITSCWYRHA
jgi:hypothetical protein